jgi:hypothetical protein
MPNFHQRTTGRRDQLPTNHCFRIAGPTRRPSICQDARRIDFHILAAHFELAAVRSDARAAPLAARAQVRIQTCAALHPALSPPLRNLLRVNERPKYALRRGIDLNLANNCVCVGTAAWCCHGASSQLVACLSPRPALPLRSFTFNEIFQIAEVGLPKHAVTAEPGINGLQRAGVQLVDAQAPLPPLVN